jgi:excisionase family DNA binding protein
MSLPQVDPDNDRLMTVDEVAKFFSVTKYTVRMWIKDGELPARKLNNKWRILKSEVVKFAQKNWGPND